MSRSFTYGRSLVSYAISMSRIALRLLLALCLVLNGVGNAMAASAMPAMHAGSHDTAALKATVADPQSASACDHDAGSDAALGEELPTPAASPATHSDNCDQDCCAEGACSCPCMQLVQATLLAPPALPAVSDRTQMVAGLSLGHPAPAPLSFIRPPIG